MGGYDLPESIVIEGFKFAWVWSLLFLSRGVYLGRSGSGMRVDFVQDLCCMIYWGGFKGLLGFLSLALCVVLRGSVLT